MGRGRGTNGKMLMNARDIEVDFRHDMEERGAAGGGAEKTRTQSRHEEDFHFGFLNECRIIRQVVMRGAVWERSVKGGGAQSEQKQANEAALTSNEVFTPEHFTTAGGFSIFGHNGQKRLRTHTMPWQEGSGRRRE